MYLGPINKMRKNVTTVSKEYIHLPVYQMAINRVDSWSWLFKEP